MDYFATFVTGCQEVIGKRLAKFPNGDLQVREIQDGLVIFFSSLSANQLSELRFLHNVYELLADTNEPVDVSALPVPDLRGTFLVRVSEQNQPAKIPDGLRQHIAVQSGAIFAAHQPDAQLLLLKRADGRVLWGRMLLRAGFKSRRIEQGELRPELAHILGLVAGLDTKDTVLDPFAGYGGIVREALQGFHVHEAIGVDLNEHLIPHLKSIPRLTALHGDARQLAHIHTRSIDRVVTDPPWGEFTAQDQGELHKLYLHALFQMHRVLRAKGAAVIVTSAPFLPEVAAAAEFDIERQYPILVSGRKATIYKLRKQVN